MKKELDKYKVPDAALEEIKKYNVNDEMLGIEIEINKTDYTDAIKNKDRKQAYAAKVEGRRLLEESKKNHEDMWSAIRKAVPEAAEGPWSLDTRDFTLVPGTRHNPAEGLSEAAAGKKR